MAAKKKARRRGVYAKQPVNNSVLFCTTPQVMQAMRDLVATGLFGSNVDACAEQLLRERLREVELRFNLPARVRRKSPKGYRG